MSGLPECEVDGCAKDVRYKTEKMCPMHYHRWWRHGDVHKTASRSAVTASYGRRYVYVYAPGHPMSGARGMAYQHRIVLYDSIGPGPHACHWCGQSVNWSTRSDPRNLQPDHLDGVGDNNDRSNLVPSCRKCNAGRAARNRHQALREAGWWSRREPYLADRGVVSD